MECGDEYIMLLYQFDEDEFARYKRKYLFCDVCGVGWWCSAVYLNTLNVIFRQNFVTDLLCVVELSTVEVINIFHA